eukprot:gene6725-23097_t
MHDLCLKACQGSPFLVGAGPPDLIVEFVGVTDEPQLGEVGAEPAAAPVATVMTLDMTPVVPLKRCPRSPTVTACVGPQPGNTT